MSTSLAMIILLIDFVDRFLTCFTVALAAARAFPNVHLLSDPLCLALHAALATQSLHDLLGADPADGLKSDHPSGPQELSHVDSLDHFHDKNERPDTSHAREHQRMELAIRNLGEQRDKYQSNQAAHPDGSSPTGPDLRLDVSMTSNSSPHGPQTSSRPSSPSREYTATRNKCMENKLRRTCLSELTNLQDELARALALEEQEGGEDTETEFSKEHMMRGRRLSFDDFEVEFWGSRLYLLRD